MALAAVLAAGGQLALQIARNSLQKVPLKSTTGVTGSGRAGSFGGGVISPISSGVQSVIDNALQPAAQTPLSQRIMGGPTLNAIQSITRAMPGAGGIQTFDIASGFRRKRYRRMNVANVKALRRAGRRVEGFVKLAKSLITVPGARAKHPIKRARRRR